MGGHRSHHPPSGTERIGNEHKRPSLDEGALLLGAAPIEDVVGGNPFLSVPASGGQSRRGLEVTDEDHTMVTSSGLRALASPIDASITTSLPSTSPQQTMSASTTPPTRSMSLASPAAAPPLPIKKKWTAPIVGEEEGNPFYVKPGEARKVQTKKVEERDWEEKETVTYVL
jgi:hypothetical protein